MLSDEELNNIKKTLTGEVIDDSEELLEVFIEFGPELIDELLKWRTAFSRSLIRSVADVK